MSEKPFVSKPQNRRHFMKESAALSMALMATTSAQGQAAETESMPSITLGDFKISRLIVGSNQMLGYSHFNRLLSRMMQDYFTIDRIVEFLNHCSQLGINAFQSSYDEKLDQALSRFRDGGGKIQWICLASGALLEKTEVLREMIKKHKPLAIAHHGWNTDRHFREGKLNLVEDFIKRVHDLDTLAGVSTHNPALLEHIDEKNWEHDFYMASFHYISRSEEELREKLGYIPVPRSEVYLQEDPAEMCASVRKVDKPTLVYKILAAGRYTNSDQSVESRFRFAFENIKKNDAVIVGMFPLYEDEAAQNVAYTKKYA